jgi:hypothetical protein
VTANSAGSITSNTINFVNTATVTVTTSNNSGIVNVAFTSVGGGGSANIAAPNGAILVANAASGANGSNNFVFNVATLRMGIGTNTVNSNIVVVGNAWITTGINAATINATTGNITTVRITTANITNGNIVTANITTGNINSAVMNSMTAVTGTINTATMSTATVSNTLYVANTITTGGAAGDIANVNRIFANSYYAKANIAQSQHTIDSTRSNSVFTQGATVNVSSFSGMIIINNWSSGGVQMWLLGGGAIGNVANTLDLTTSNTGSFSFSSPNYVWTCANTATYTITSVRTREYS